MFFLDRTDKDTNLLLTMTLKEIKREKEIFSSRESQVTNMPSIFNFIRLYYRWIPEKFDELAHKAFSFVHIDVDLYKLPIGAFIIIK